ncbi:aldo/keto reductase [Candidatus Babeliales bacterium]|nr:aldo/keto reductase [Candidatus Babeliales bacterium]
MKLGIGTIQFGLAYGISNKEGQVAFDDGKKILSLAAETNISVLDTANSYGLSEEALGRLISENHKFKIITKTPKFLKGSAENLERAFCDSLLKLKQRDVYGLLVHRTDDLFEKDGEQLWQKMVELKKRGLVKKIGVSVYDSNQLDMVLNKYPIDLVQLPVNLFDQRLVNNGYLKKLKKLNVEIHARSIFLQGLLLMKTEELSSFFDSLHEHFKKYHFFLKDNEITSLEASLDFVLKIKEIDCVLVGVCSAKQLNDILFVTMNSFAKEINYSCLEYHDELILNPSLWKQD